MNRVINFIKMDFRNVRAALTLTFKREIPNWIFVPYYAIGAILSIPLLPLLGVWYLWLKYEIWKFTRE